MKKALFATLLAFVMFIPSLSADELNGTFEAIIPESSKVEIKPAEANADVTYLVKEANLQWVAKDESIGRDVDGYWIGLKITAPTNYSEDKATFTATFYNGKSIKYSYKESLDEPTTNKNIVSAWFNVTPEAKEALKGNKDGVEIIKYEFDWDGDGKTNQTLTVKVIADSITLGDVPETHKTVTFESEKGTKTFTVENGKSLEEYLTNETEKGLLDNFLAAPKGKELDRMYIEVAEKEEKEFKLSDKVTSDIIVKVLYKEKTPANPKTGDNISLYGFMGIISLLCLALLAKFRKAN